VKTANITPVLVVRIANTRNSDHSMNWGVKSWKINVTLVVRHIGLRMASSELREKLVEVVIERIMHEISHCNFNSD